MAIDWIKMRADLRTHPKVVRMASALNADRLRVIGGLHAVWCVFDAHSSDGFLDGYTTEILDEILGWSGFSAAMASIEWLISLENGLETPRFDEHNSQSAKRRAMETERKRKERENVLDLSALDADKNKTESGLEKKRKEKNIKPLESKTEASQRGSRLPTDWIIPAGYILFCTTERPDLDVQAMADKFRDYWIGVPGSRGCKLNWEATWRNFVRAERRALSAGKKPPFDPLAYANGRPQRG